MFWGFVRLELLRASNLSKDRTNNTHFHGEIAEVIVYNEDLSSSAMRVVEGYLAHKWGTVSTLNVITHIRNMLLAKCSICSDKNILGGDRWVNPTLWENVIDVGEVYVGLRRLEKGISVLAAPKPNDSGGTYSEQKLVDLQFPADGWRSTWTAWFKKIQS